MLYDTTIVDHISLVQLTVDDAVDDTTIVDHISLIQLTVDGATDTTS